MILFFGVYNTSKNSNLASTCEKWRKDKIFLSKEMVFAKELNLKMNFFYALLPSILEKSIWRQKQFTGRLSKSSRGELINWATVTEWEGNGSVFLSSCPHIPHHNQTGLSVFVGNHILIWTPSSPKLLMVTYFH